MKIIFKIIYMKFYLQQVLQLYTYLVQLYYHILSKQIESHSFF